MGTNLLDTTAIYGDVLQDILELVITLILQSLGFTELLGLENSVIFAILMILIRFLLFALWRKFLKLLQRWHNKNP